MIVWLNGALVAEKDARISPFDHGLLTGDGVFETLRVYEGIPFAWTRHLARLARSADALGLHAPDAIQMRAAARGLLEANRLTDARLRLTVTGGAGPLGSDRGNAAPTVLMSAAPLLPRQPATRVVTVPWTRNEHGAVAGLKTISYAENVRALAYAVDRDADEALFANTSGALCEGTGSNVFLVKDGRVTTPPLASGCLAGVTRELVLELLRSRGRDAEERIALEERISAGALEGRIPMEALTTADEVFLTSSTREVQAVEDVDGVMFSAPGPVTLGLARAFSNLVQRAPDP